MRAPLDGIRVVELTSWMAAPSAGAILSDIGPRGQAPKLGQHTDEILRAAGVDDRELAELRSEGTIS